MSTEAIETLAEIGTPTNPFPGLRPFEFDESHLFFGRDGQSEQLISKLGRTRFVAVVGTSGSGKSSLVRAGLLPTLLGGFMTSAGSGWRVAIMRPGNDPVGNLAQALNAPDVFGSEIEGNAAIQTAIAEATLRRGSLGLVDTVRQAAMPENENLLVVADQFEEIFRFARISEGKAYNNEAAAFVKLILEASRQREIPIYVVLTMRSDYLGDCSEFWDLPEAINESQYLIPRLTRDQLREAITGPVAVGGGKITARLVNRLLNDVGDDQDQLPVLQHLLMRVWDERKEKRLEVEHIEAPGAARGSHKRAHQGEAIDLCCYEAVGGMTEALSRHADEAFNELPDDRHREVAEKLFKALTEKGPDNREIRHPITLGEISLVVDATAAEVITVIDAFRHPRKSFLMPPAGKELECESLIDISHESLIRGWERLRTWVDEEARSARIYRRLAETAELHSEGNAGLWGDPDLQLALDWQGKNKPNKNWALRYHPGFDLAIAFLLASQQKRKVDEAERERQQKAELERTQRELEQAQALADAQQQRAAAERKRLKALVAMVLLALAIAVFAFFAYRRAETARAAANKQREIARQLLYTANINLAQKRFEDGDLVTAQELLNTFLPTPGSPKSDDLREFEWYYLWRHNYKEKAALEGHTEEIGSVAFSPDGKMLATASKDTTVKLWDVSSGHELATLKGHKGIVDSVAFSPDGKSLATGSGDKTVKLWDVSTRQELATLNGHTDSVSSVAFSPDGKTLASGSGDKTAKLWDVSSGQELATLSGHSGQVSSVAFSPDGKMLAIASRDNTVKLWELSPRQELATLTGHYYVCSVAYSPDGKTLATGSLDNSVKLWDMTTRQELATLKGHIGGANSVAFSPDGKTLAVGSQDATVKLWDVSTQQEVATINGHAGYVSSVAFSPDGKTLASASVDKTVKLWDVSSRQEPAATLNGNGGIVYSVAFSPDGKTLAIGNSDKAKLWDVSTRQEVTTLYGHLKPVCSVAFSPDGKTLATGSFDKTVKLWDVSTRQELATLYGHADLVTSMAFSPDGKTLATGSFDKTVKLWDVSTRQELATLHGHTDFVNSVAFSPDGKMLATASSDKTMKLWDLNSGQELATFNTVLYLFSVAFSPDGKMLATGGKDKTVKLWDVSTRQELATLSGHTDAVSSIEFSPDGKTLATGSFDKTVKLWDIRTRQELATLKGHTETVRSVAFSPDGKSLATGSEDKTVKLWFAATDDEVAAQRRK